MKRALLLILCCLSAKASAIKGRVVDSQGAAVEKAHVMTYANQQQNLVSGAPVEQTAVSDPLGNFSIDVADGFYDVCAFSGGFTAVCKKVLVSHASSKTYKFVLRADPYMSNKIADHFPTH